MPAFARLRCFSFLPMAVDVRRALQFLRSASGPRSGRSAPRWASSGRLDSLCLHPSCRRATTYRRNPAGFESFVAVTESADVHGARCALSVDLPIWLQNNPITYICPVPQRPPSLGRVTRRATEPCGPGTEVVFSGAPRPRSDVRSVGHRCSCPWDRRDGLGGECRPLRHGHRRRSHGDGGLRARTWRDSSP